MTYPRYPQHGAGFGNVFKAIMRVTTPLVKRLIGSDFAKRVSKRALKIGSEELSNFADDIMKGDSIKESAKKRARGAVDRMQTGKGGARKQNVTTKKRGPNKGGKKGGVLGKNETQRKTPCSRKTIFD